MALFKCEVVKDKSEQEARDKMNKFLSDNEGDILSIEGWGQSQVKTPSQEGDITETTLSVIYQKRENKE